MAKKKQLLQLKIPYIYTYVKFNEKTGNRNNKIVRKTIQVILNLGQNYITLDITLIVVNMLMNNGLSFMSR